MDLLNFLPGFFRQVHEASQPRVDFMNRIKDAACHASHGEMRVRRRSQLTKSVGLTEIELSENAAMIRIGHDILRDLRFVGS